MANIFWIEKFVFKECFVFVVFLGIISIFHFKRPSDPGEKESVYPAFTDLWMLIEKM